jgi:omega-hydroxy-beta-dihydromenaquinone-9 sulfotransferase
MTPLNKPIIIVGTGRCGSTIFHRVFATHPNVMWLSGFSDRYPATPAVNRWAVTAMGNPLLRRMFGEKIQPGECYVFWDRHAYGFSTPFRDLLKEDVTPRIKKQVRRAMEGMLTPARNRLLIKIAGWSRIGFLKEIFPDAKFVHIVRDGRAVASSVLHVDFWRGWRGPQGWNAGMLSPDDQAVWDSTGRSFVALAGIQWQLRTRAMESARAKIDPQDFFEVKYESFCDQPVETYRRVLEFAELPQSAEFERHIKEASIKSTSNRWRDDLTPPQQAILDKLLRDDLLRYGYDVAR